MKNPSQVAFAHRQTLLAQQKHPIPELLEEIEAMTFEDFQEPGFEHTPTYLLWMCIQVINNWKEWPLDKSHRWLGYISKGLIDLEISNLHWERTKVRVCDELGFWRKLTFIFR